MSENVKILKRSEVAEENTWNLADLYETDEAWEAELVTLQGYIPKLQAFQGHLMDSAKTLLDFMRLDDELSLKLRSFHGYAMMKNDQDSTVAKYQECSDKARTLYVSIASASSFATPEILAADDETVERFYKEEPDLELYRVAINRLRARKAHILSDKEEAILAQVGRITGTASNAYSTFESADIKFPDIEWEDGSKTPLTNGSFIPYMENENRAIRKQAFEKLYHTYESYKNTLAALYNGEVKARILNSTVRKYSSNLEAALSGNEVPTSVYHNLIDAVHTNFGYMHKYMRLRKKLLGVDELHMYDIYTSLVPDANVKVSYEDAKKEILEAMQVLGDDYVAMLREGFENRWIDVYENEGKRSGAYSAGARPHPYVLLNQKDTLDSEFTIVHEMGHSLHSYLSMKNQPVAYSDYVIFVAEVASTCNEALLMQYLLGKTTDKRQRAYLINYFLEQFRTTLYRQTMFAEFELLTNEMAERGESLTAEALCALYHKLNADYYGDDVVIDREIDFEWERIPHFYYDFYVFQYATGFSAAIALSRRILREGEPAVKDYLKFLSSGCSTDPISLLKIAGVDMNSPEPVNDALELFGELIDELDELLS